LPPSTRGDANGSKITHRNETPFSKIRTLSSALFTCRAAIDWGLGIANAATLQSRLQRAIGAFNNIIDREKLSKCVPGVVVGTDHVDKVPDQETSRPPERLVVSDNVAWSMTRGQRAATARHHVNRIHAVYSDLSLWVDSKTAFSACRRPTLRGDHIVSVQPAGLRQTQSSLVAFKDLGIPLKKPLGSYSYC